MPESSIAVPSGLFTAQEVPVPLGGVSVDADISAFCARVSVTQRYVNREANPIEAVYVFPLDEGAAVCGFEAIIDGTLVVGEVKEREEAFRMYDDAMEQGHGAFLLDEERPDVFQASVGNLPPGKEALLKLTYVTELAVEGGGLRFTIPTTVSPRYAPVEDQRGLGRPDSEALNPPVAWRVPYGLELSVRVRMGGAISGVGSPSHPVSVSVEGSQATVRLSQRDAALDRDFVLSVQAAGLDTPQAWIERADGGDAIAVAFVPALPDASVPAEVIFLVDRSGSMGGTSIEEVRNALQLCLRSMIAGCRFNIIGFGSTYQALFESSRSYDEASLTEAAAHVAGLRANLGGTELLPALEFALSSPAASELTRQVVVLTDGEVTNTDAVLALAKKHAAAARVFTFGIGAGASHHLVKGLARAGGGAAEFIYPGERIEPKVVRQFGRLLSPALTNVRMDWGGLELAQAPSTVPPVFTGGRFLLYGLMKSGRSVVAPTQARLTATSPSGPVSFDLPLDPARAVDGRTVAVLAARARIRELEESPDWIESRGSRQGRRKSAAVAQEIIDLGLRFGLMSRETSYIAIERRDAPIVGDLQLRRVPIALTSGWGGLDVAMMYGRRADLDTMMVSGVPARATLPPTRMTRDARGLSEEPRVPFPERASLESVSRMFRRERTSRPAARTIPPPPPEGMHALVALQRADGSWDLTRELAQVIGRSATELEEALAGATGDASEARRAWATALALVWLRTNARQVEAEWSLLAVKARRWLDDTKATPPGGGAWMNAAARLLSA